MKTLFSNSFVKTLSLVVFMHLLSPLSAQNTERGREALAGKNELAGKKAFPQALGWVNDFEEVLDSATEEKLTKLIVDHNRKTTNQISIVTISSIAPYEYLSEYAKDLSNAWGVGEKDKNNGVTIIYSKALREVRIATGYGIEEKLTDSMCQNIVDTLMIPAFKNGDYGKGLIDGVSEIIHILEK